MLKFVKIFFLPLFIAALLACNQYLKSENAQTPKYSFEVKQLDSSTHNKYSWLANYDVSQNIVNRIPVPKGFTRVSVEKGSFQDWLRHLPLKKEGSAVNLYDGSLKYNQDAHFAVINIDAGSEDLQQCADACMRLKAEYLFSKKDFENIHFKFTSGDNATWDMWKEGFRPQIKGNKVSWIKKAGKDESYKNFKSYLKTVFNYCGTYSLSNEMLSIKMEEIKAGDLFIKGGFPGHAVIVVDIAENKTTGEMLFMVAQSYMPAQDIHILKNSINESLNPWYSVNFGEQLNTPEWTFDRNQLKRFKQ